MRGMIDIPRGGWDIVPVKRILRDGRVYWTEPKEEAFCHRDLAPAQLSATGAAIWINRGRVQRFGGGEYLEPQASHYKLRRFLENLP